MTSLTKFLSVVFSITLLFAVPARAEETYTFEEMTANAGAVLGDTTEGLAKVIEKVFTNLGRPNGYIAGEEVSGAIGVGLRYGKGVLKRKAADPLKVFWQGPSIGWDVGGNASKVFTLIYKLENAQQLYQRFPAVEGSFYYVAGATVSYQQSGDVILAPIRTGAGLRTGANIGYLHYGPEHSWLPF